MIIQKNDLQIAKIKRLKIGNYTVGVMKQGDFSQIEPDKTIMKEYFVYKKKLIKEKQLEISDKVLNLQNSLEDHIENKEISDNRSKDIKTFDHSDLIKNKLIQ